MATDQKPFKPEGEEGFLKFLKKMEERAKELSDRPAVPPAPVPVSKCPLCGRYKFSPPMQDLYSKEDIEKYKSTWKYELESVHDRNVPRKACSEEHLQKYLAGEAAAGNRLEFPLPPRYAAWSFENFIPYLPSLQRKVEFLRKWVNGNHETGLFLCGSVGSGKSHLQAAIFRELALKYPSVAFIRMFDFLDMCYAAFDNDSTPGKVVESLNAYKYLLIDDLGTEKATEFKRERVLGLIDACYSDPTMLIITSNCSLSDLSTLDPRISSRLAEMCVVLQFNDPDYRVVLAKNRTVELAGEGKEVTQ
jgi:DNA replication protein DnaC